MRSLRFIDRRSGSILTAFALLFATALPGLVPAFASADQVTSRSITMSDSSAAATSVSYEVKFTTVSAAGAFVLDFCNDSPIAAQTCTAPTGFSVASVNTTTGSTTAAPFGSSTSTVLVTKTMGSSANVDVVLTGIHNPTNPTDATAGNGFYARIITYADATTANTEYTDVDPGADAVDNGGIALAITNSIGVSAAVRESMTFCVANQTITQDCGDAATTGHEPNLTLGESAGGSSVALIPSALSTGDVYTQLSTNAASGAVVNLKSNATDCGGLLRVGGSGCSIGPAPQASFSAGQAYFGVKTGTSDSTSGDANAMGTLEPVSGSHYNSSGYYMGFAAGNATGVTSPYGDPFLDSSAGPINNQNMHLVFGASVSPSTPAGIYRATLNMIATGRF